MLRKKYLLLLDILLSSEIPLIDIVSSEDELALKPLVLGSERYHINDRILFQVAFNVKFIAEISMLEEENEFIGDECVKLDGANIEAVDIKGVRKSVIF